MHQGSYACMMCDVFDTKKEVVFVSITSTKRKSRDVYEIILLSTIFQGSCHWFFQRKMALLNASLLVEEDILQIYYSKCCAKLKFQWLVCELASTKKSANSSVHKATLYRMASNFHSIKFS